MWDISLSRTGMLSNARAVWQDVLRPLARRLTSCLRHRSVRTALVFCICLALMLLRRLPSGLETAPGGDGSVVVRFPGRTLNARNTSGCRNSEQGPQLVADDRGYACAIQDVQPSGCCPADVKATARYSCAGCQADNCCAVYEHCVTCCTDPVRADALAGYLRNTKPRFQVMQPTGYQLSNLGHGCFTRGGEERTVVATARWVAKVIDTSCKKKYEAAFSSLVHAPLFFKVDV